MSRPVNLDGHSILMEFHAERRRAHDKHRDDSIETKNWQDPDFLHVVGEEALEVFQAYGATRHGAPPHKVSELRAELVQLGAMTEAWVQAIDAAFQRGDFEPF